MNAHDCVVLFGVPDVENSEARRRRRRRHTCESCGISIYPTLRRLRHHRTRTRHRIVSYRKKTVCTRATIPTEIAISQHCSFDGARTARQWTGDRIVCIRMQLEYRVRAASSCATNSLDNIAEQRQQSAEHFSIHVAVGFLRRCCTQLQFEIRRCVRLGITSSENHPVLVWMGTMGCIVCMMFKLDVMQCNAWLDMCILQQNVRWNYHLCEGSTRLDDKKRIDSIIQRTSQEYGNSIDILENFPNPINHNQRWKEQVDQVL